MLRVVVAVFWMAVLEKCAGASAEQGARNCFWVFLAEVWHVALVDLVREWSSLVGVLDGQRRGADNAGKQQGCADCGEKLHVELMLLV